MRDPIHILIAFALGALAPYVAWRIIKWWVLRATRPTHGGSDADE